MRKILDKTKHHEIIKQRILSNIEVQQGCWILKNYCVTQGYPILSYCGKPQKASRTSYMVFKGEVAKGVCVCHSCDNTYCVNPDHLWLGTQKDNLLDMVKKSRHFKGKELSEKVKQYAKRGEENNLTKLTVNKVLEIKKNYLILKSCKKTGEMFGVCAQTVNNIVRGLTWKHI